MTHKIYFELSIDSLRSLGGWAADCAEKVLQIFEARVARDERPRKAIAGIRAFAAGAARSRQLRVIALDAYRASLETEDAAASAAAQAASLAASSAFTHPLVDVQQTKHILGAAAYAALAFELEQSDPARGDMEISRSVESVPAAVCELLANMPNRSIGKSRVETLMFNLDVELRKRIGS
jgi:hypothetical protein